MRPKFTIFKKIRSLFSRRIHKKKKKRQSGAGGPYTDFKDIGQREADMKKMFLADDLDENLQRVTEISGNSYDLSIIRFLAGPDEIKAALIYIDGMINNDSISNLLRIVKIDTFKTDIDGIDKTEIYETIKNRLLASENNEVRDLEGLFQGISLGDAALLIDGTARAIVSEAKGWQVRALTEPEAETVLRGPREGFVESIRASTAMIRRRIRSPNLWIESMTVGNLTRTEVAIAYIKGLAGEEILEELRSRLESIDIDGVLESGTIEEFIQDAPESPFPTIFRTERPDRVAANILEGRVAIFTDGTPFVLVLPAALLMYLQSPDDYSEVWPIGSFIRFLRMFSFLISIFLPGVYIAVLNYHPELLPTSLLLTIQQTEEGVPFPLVVELIIMELAFEVLREAGIRLPKAIGSAMSIVGALILGEAAFQAGIVSPGVVIIVAFTAIASFTSPSFSLAITARILRFAVILLGATLGLLGVQFAFLTLLIHVVSLRSFGIPYGAPFGPLIQHDLKDSVVRTHWWDMIHRPRLTGFHEPGRQPTGQGPHTPGMDNRKPKKRGKGK
ncbi:MAG TPA: spore germination protein [Firmicutes bacterium]|nr:spore germination protein [Bacillota bacterium]